MRFVFILSSLLLWGASAIAADKLQLLNVSYDPTRELYQQINEAFTKEWQAGGGQEIQIRQSHGGSATQARAVMDGLQADVVTLALAYDIDVLADKAKLLPANWQSRLPGNSSPYTSTIVFLVRKGNPKNIHDWSDLTKPGISVITPNPKTSGGARWNYLAAWAYGLKQGNNDEAKAKEFVASLFKNVPILDTGARGSTITFVQRGIGDVLLSWENEAYLAVNQLGKDQFDVVIPSISILTEPPVAVVDSVVDKHGSRKVAEAYLQFLYSHTGQEIIAKNYYRPYDKDVAGEYAKTFPPVHMVTIADFGGWKAAQQKHFADGGTFDQIIGQK